MLFALVALCGSVAGANHFGDGTTNPSLCHLCARPVHGCSCYMRIEGEYYGIESQANDYAGVSGGAGTCAGAGEGPAYFGPDDHPCAYQNAQDSSYDDDDGVVVIDLDVMAKDLDAAKKFINAKRQETDFWEVELKNSKANYTQAERSYTTALINYGESSPEVKIAKAELMRAGREECEALTNLTNLENFNVENELAKDLGNDLGSLPLCQYSGPSRASRDWTSSCLTIPSGGVAASSVTASATPTPTPTPATATPYGFYAGILSPVTFSPNPNKGIVCSPDCVEGLASSIAEALISWGTNSAMNRDDLTRHLKMLKNLYTKKTEVSPDTGKVMTIYDNAFENAISGDKEVYMDGKPFFTGSMQQLAKHVGLNEAVFLLLDPGALLKPSSQDPSRASAAGAGEDESASPVHLPQKEIEPIWKRAFSPIARIIIYEWPEKLEDSAKAQELSELPGVVIDRFATEIAGYLLKCSTAGRIEEQDVTDAEQAITDYLALAVEKDDTCGDDTYKSTHQSLSTKKVMRIDSEDGAFEYVECSLAHLAAYFRLSEVLKWFIEKYPSLERMRASMRKCDEKKPDTWCAKNGNNSLLTPYYWTPREMELQFGPFAE